MAKEGSKRVDIVGMDDKLQYLDAPWKENFCRLRSFMVIRLHVACPQLTPGTSHTLQTTGQMKKPQKVNILVHLSNRSVVS